MGIPMHRGVARRPRRGIPRRDALTLAGNMANSSDIRPSAAHHRVASNRRPTPPASSISPVEKTSKSGRGKPGGTIAIRSFLIGAKCAMAVKTNIVARAKRALAIHAPKTVTPRAPRCGTAAASQTKRSGLAYSLCVPRTPSPACIVTAVFVKRSTKPLRPRLIGCNRVIPPLDQVFVSHLPVRLAYDSHPHFFP